MVNCVGILHVWRFSSASMPRERDWIGRRAAASGVARLVHLSAIGAREDAPSQYAATKGVGERAAARGFPQRDDPAAIAGVRTRGSICSTGFAAMARMLAVHAGDLRGYEISAGLCRRCGGRGDGGGIARPDAAGAVYELGGPRVWSMRELLAYVLKETGRSGHRMISIPTGLMRGSRLGFSNIFRARRSRAISC